MNKAEERAYEAYPKMSRISEPHGLIPADNKSHYLGDGNEEKREGFIAGYHQAEKDLELSWEDIMEICGLSVLVEFYLGRLVSDERHYTEVLKRFKDFKERKEL